MIFVIFCGSKNRPFIPQRTVGTGIPFWIPVLWSIREAAEEITEKGP